MKIKLTILTLAVLLALSPTSAFAQQTSKFYTPTNQERYNYKHGCNIWEPCHNALAGYRDPGTIFEAVGRLGNSYGVWPDSMTTENPLQYPNLFCHPNDPNCGQSVDQQQYHRQQYYQRNYQQPSQHGQQQFTPQPNHYAPPVQQCGWYTIQGQQQPTWLCQP